MNCQTPGIPRRFRPSGSNICFTIAACSLGAALLGAVVNLFLTGWMAVGGMTMVGLFYFGMGLAEVQRERSAPQDRRDAAAYTNLRDPTSSAACDQTRSPWDRISESVMADG